MAPTHRFLPLCFILSAVLFNLPITSSFPSGAPKSSCVDLTPQHRTGGSLRIWPNLTTSPYRIVAEATYTPQGTFVRGAITGDDEPFKGFILQARAPGSDTPVGQFVWSSEESSRPLNCVHPNDTLTHPNINDKQKMSFIWTTGQGEPQVEKIQFWATVAKSYGQFWKNIQSEVISLKGDNSHHDTSLIPAQGTKPGKASTGETVQNSNPGQYQPVDKLTSILVGKKTPLNSTPATKNEPGSANGRGIRQPPSSFGNHSQFQQPPSFWRPHRKQQQQWGQRQWPQNFSPDSRLPPLFGDRRQQQQPPQQPPNMWVEPKWFVGRNHGFPSSAYPQSPRVNNQMPRNSWGRTFYTPLGDGDPVTFPNRDPIGSWSFSSDSHVTIAAQVERSSAMSSSRFNPPWVVLTLMHITLAPLVSAAVLLQ